MTNLGTDSPSHEGATSRGAECESQPLGRSISLEALFFSWMALVCALTFAGLHRVAAVFLFAGVLIPWAAIMAVAWLVPPPKPLAETRLLAQRLSWVVRAGWASVVLVGSAVISTTVALQVQANAKDPDVWGAVFDDLFVSVVLPALAIATVLASSAIPFQLARVDPAHREAAVETLVGPLAGHGVPTVWLKRLISEVTAVIPALLVCYLGPLIVIMVAVGR